MQIHKLKDVTMIPQGNESLVKCRERERERKGEKSTLYLLRTDLRLICS